MNESALVVSEAHAGARLDVFLVREVPHMTRALATKLAGAGKVRINGRRCKKGDRLQAGDQVTLEALPEPADFTPAPAPHLALEVLYEDADVVVVSKPRGLPTHPLSREETDTLAQALLARYPEMEGVGYAQREPGILHRLDTDTSGVLVAARHAQAFDALKASQRAGTWDKRYLAFCEGAPRAPDRIVAALRPDPDDKRKMSVVYGSEEGDAERERITELLEVEPLGALKSADGARVQVSAVTLAVHNATRHQVRAHLAFYGHPLVGDELYGGAGLEGETGPTAHWLHASQVEFPLPSAKIPGERVVVRAPESELMQALRRRAAV